MCRREDRSHDTTGYSNRYEGDDIVAGVLTANNVGIIHILVYYDSTRTYHLPRACSNAFRRASYHTKVYLSVPFPLLPPVCISRSVDRCVTSCRPSGFARGQVEEPPRPRAVGVREWCSVAGGWQATRLMWTNWFGPLGWFLSGLSDSTQ